MKIKLIFALFCAWAAIEPSLLAAKAPEVTLATRKANFRRMLRGERTDAKSLQEHYRLATLAYADQRWGSAAYHAGVIVDHASHLPMAAEMAYIRGKSYFELGRFDKSNQALSTYLQLAVRPHHLTDVMQMKYAIALYYAEGGQKPLFDLEGMPKLISGSDDAISVFDEMVAALPRDQMAISALFEKGRLLAKGGHYREAIETYEMLIRRFGKHDLAIESYIQISDCYLKHTQDCYPELHFLELARINQAKFAEDFPLEPRQALVEKNVKEMEEVFAASFLDMAELFADQGRPDSSLLYYKSIVALYPATQSAVIASQWIDKANSQNPEFQGEGILVQAETSS